MPSHDRTDAAPYLRAVRDALTSAGVEIEPYATRVDLDPERERTLSWPLTIDVAWAFDEAHGVSLSWSETHGWRLTVTHDPGGARGYYHLVHVLRLGLLPAPEAVAAAVRALVDDPSGVVHREPDRLRRPEVADPAFESGLLGYHVRGPARFPSHEPPHYPCPFSALAGGGRNRRSGQAEIVRRTAGALAFVSPRLWPNHRGHVIVVPTGHHENIYDLPAEAAHAVADLVRDVAVAVRSTYGCDGVSTRQHNEPAGNQDVWHLHVHVFPRYAGDDLYGTKALPGYATVEERLPYTERLKDFFGV
ncbi:MAG TPA: DUF6292 family protein [Phytomonospora sp.]